MTPLVTLENVGVDFPIRSGRERVRHQVLSGLNLSISRGDRLGIVGKNGVGKSTLLRVIGKILPPSQGAVTWAQSVTVSLLSLGLGFRNELNGRDNAYLSALLQGLQRKEARQILPAIEAFCELGDYFYEPVKTYSSGMRARLGFATSVVTRSKVLLIDEVLAVGDRNFRDKAKQYLKNSFSEDQAVVLVSHIDAQVQEWCRTALLIRTDGTVVHGAASEIISRPDR